MSAVQEPDAVPPRGNEFSIRMSTRESRPDRPYTAWWTWTDADGRTTSREVGSGDYRWAIQTARRLSIPRTDIEHDSTPGVDDGYEGWHLNARIVE